jgi:collagenase-like PrtC family protease
VANLKFSLPYNNNPDTLKQMLNLQGYGGSSIYEVYLSGPQEYSGSGRIVSMVSMDDFVDKVNLIHTAGIRVNLVLNTVCGGANWYTTHAKNQLIDYLNRMHREHGVEAVTVANPVYMEEIKQRVPELEVCASVLSDIDSVQRALVAKRAGADVITPDANINRNLSLLKEIKVVTGLKLKLMVNEGCLYRCLYRKFHFNYVSHYSKEVNQAHPEMKDFFTHCMSMTSQDHSQILKSGWIRPEDLESYTGITDLFKIVGRTQPGSMVLRTASAYMGKSYPGNVFDLMCSSLNAFSMTYGAYLDSTRLSEAGFFQKLSTCSQQCSSCKYCENLALDLVKLKMVTREKLEDLGRKELADKLEAEGRLPFAS